MIKIGIDVGSTYTKFCIMDHKYKIISLFSEKTPINQIAYFEEKVERMREVYPGSSIVSCGYGRENIRYGKIVNELIALAKGAEFLMPKCNYILDIGGQDTKAIYQENGHIKKFFMNDVCAAGSGQFLLNVTNQLGLRIDEIMLIDFEQKYRLSTTCAVFAQGEIVKMIADNVSEKDILSAVIMQIINQTKNLIGKLGGDNIYLTGGFVNIPGIEQLVGKTLGISCKAIDNGNYAAAIGCALYAM